jgi:hypothetical protein
MSFIIFLNGEICLFFLFFISLNIVTYLVVSRELRGDVD